MEDTSPDRTLMEWLGKTKTAARRTIGALLKTKRRDEWFADEQLVALIQHHPTKKFPTNATFVLTKRPPYGTVSLFVAAKTGGLIDCSWVKCVENLYGAYDADARRRTQVVQAFRNEAFQSTAMQSARERLGEIGNCGRCGERKKLHVDHDVKPFAQLVDEFLDGESLESIKTWYDGKAFRLKSKAKEWQEFHDREATLIGLCAFCNQSKGSSGYRRKNNNKT